jgi:hypothetical protein
MESFEEKSAPKLKVLQLTKFVKIKYMTRARAMESIANKIYT